MSTLQRWTLRLALLTEAAGILFVGAAGYFSVMLLADRANPLRHEYSLGVWFGLLYGFAALLLATFLAVSVKKVVAKGLFRLLTIPTLIVGIVLLGLYFYGAAVDLFTRAT